MEFNQATQSFQNQATESYHNPAPRNPASESFYLSEMRKLEVEKALWQKDERMFCKEITRLNNRIQEEVERRTDYEFEKAALQEELDACYGHNDLLQLQLRKKCDELEKLRYRCSKLENQINSGRQQLQQQTQPQVVVANKGSGYQFFDGRNNTSSSSLPASWAERCKAGEGEAGRTGRRRFCDVESDFAQSSLSSIASKAAGVASSASSSDASEGDDDFETQLSDFGNKKKKQKSSTLTRRKETNNHGNISGKGVATRGETTASHEQIHEINHVGDDLTALKYNINIVNKKMAKNDRDIQKLESYVQSLTMKRD